MQRTAMIRPIMLNEIVTLKREEGIGRPLVGLSTPSLTEGIPSIPVCSHGIFRLELIHLLNFFENVGVYCEVRQTFIDA
jgi:hypothetical protein